MAVPVVLEGFAPPSPDRWFFFNYHLNLDADPCRLNLPLLEHRQLVLEDLELPRTAYWLAQARLFELALILAGSYVDACELGPAAELLDSPLVRLGGGTRLCLPIVGGFARGAGAARNHIQVSLSASKTAAARPGQVRDRAWLPELNDSLVLSGRFNQAYLESINDRLCLVRARGDRLRGRGLVNSERLCRILSGLDDEQQRAWWSGRCDFGLNNFQRLGCEYHQLLHYGRVQSRYLAGQPA